MLLKTILRDSPEITSRFRFTSKIIFFTKKTQSSRSLKEKSFLCVLRAFVVKDVISGLILNKCHKLRSFVYQSVELAVYP